MLLAKGERELSGSRWRSAAGFWAAAAAMLTGLALYLWVPIAGELPLGLAGSVAIAATAAFGAVALYSWMRFLKALAGRPSERDGPEGAT